MKFGASIPNFNNIKKNCCPKCGGELTNKTITIIGGMIKDRVIWHRADGCDFQITQSNYIKAGRSKITQELVRELSQPIVY